ncbi:MAG: alpha/beta hydrolase [Candidatus Eremiobacteraeota bacterium]|nr:alpha/beta hydrolase [Candidatus Eremiobacteraeota bacterium]
MKIFTRLFMVWWLSAALPAQQPFVLAWLGDGSQLSEFTIGETLYNVHRIQDQPDHIVVLVHGYNVPREDGASQFQEVADRCYGALAKLGRTSVVVGLEWDSAAPGAQTPWRAKNAYLTKVERARIVGHNAARQVLLRLQKEFPRAKINVLAHSLGCEVSAGALFPNIVYEDEIPKTASYDPAQAMRWNCWALTGSDLDYNVWYNGQVEFESPQSRADLLWMTISPYVGNGFRDQVLQVRQAVRGMAGGSAFPHMTERQYDSIFSRRAVFFDQRDIPQGHEFVRYFSEQRLAHILAAAVWIGEHPVQGTLPAAGPTVGVPVVRATPPRGFVGPQLESLPAPPVPAELPEPSDLADLDRVLAAPNRIEELLPWLEAPNSSAQLYALWRLERLLCGGSQHFADETLDKVTRLLRSKPRTVWAERENSPCESVRRGYWPTEALMTKAGAPAWSR